MLEFEEVAQLVLDATAFGAVAGSDRSGFDRITFRPHAMTPTLDLDLTVTLFGEPHFAPIVVGPIAEQRRFHRDGEIATARGASAAHAGVTISNRSSAAIADIARESKSSLWFAAYLDTPEIRPQIERALAAGCQVLCGAAPPGQPFGTASWRSLETLAKSIGVPLLVKGVASADDAKRALNAGAKGVVVAGIEPLAAIVEATAGRATILVDGSFRRGSDVAKALILGAHAVLIARPIMWGLAAYGAEGVQTVLELIQSDLGRTMASLGAVNVKSLTSDMIRIHKR